MINLHTVTSGQNRNQHNEHCNAMKDFIISIELNLPFKLNLVAKR